MSQQPISEQTNLKATPIKLIIITGVSFIALIVTLIFAGQKNVLALDDNKLMVIQQAKVEVSDISIQSSYIKPRTVYGRVESLQQSQIGFELNGLLKEVIVKEGRVVNKGDVLAQLDTARLVARKQELESSLKSAQANARIASLSANRFKDLVAKKVESQQRLDEALANLDAADALVNEVDARLASLEVEIQKSTLFAPFSGQIVTQILDEGTVVNAGQGVFVILQSNELEARFGLPEQTAYKLQPQQPVVLKAQDMTLPAIVKSIAKQRNLSTRTIDAVMTIDINQFEKPPRLVTGDLVSLTVDIPIAKTGAWVPMSSLASAVRGLWTIYVVNNNRVETRLVSIEFVNNDFAYVSGAIAQGDKLVVTGIHRLAPNQQVSNMINVPLNDFALNGLNKKPHQTNIIDNHLTLNTLD